MPGKTVSIFIHRRKSQAVKLLKANWKVGIFMTVYVIVAKELWLQHRSTHGRYGRPVWSRIRKAPPLEEPKNSRAERPAGA